MPTITDSFLLYTTPIGWGGGGKAGSHKVVSKQVAMK